MCIPISFWHFPGTIPHHHQWVNTPLNPNPAIFRRAADVIPA
jgi:hypothetical protein